MKLPVFKLGWNLKNWKLLGKISIQFVNHLFLHNLGVLNSNPSDNVLYSVSFTFKFAKQKMAAKILQEP